MSLYARKCVEGESVRHGSLESGLGGFDYAADQLGWDNVFHCEINKFCQTILKYYWPNAESYTDIFEMDGTKWRGRVDIISAGFPCQPFSHAGKRKGTTDDRFIWPENLRIIKEAQPSFVVAENVPGLLTIENGMVFERVCADLENEGYEVTPFIIPACAKEAVHRRDRIWIVAYNESLRWSSEAQSENGREEIQQQRGCGFIDSVNDATDTNRPENDTETNINGRGEQKFNNGAEVRNKPATGSGAVVTDYSEQGLPERQQPGKISSQKEGSAGLVNRTADNDRDDTNGNHKGLEGHGQYGERTGERIIRTGNDQETWLEAAARLCVLDVQSATGLDATAFLKETGISYSKWRNESLKSLGNTIMWQVAYEIFSCIQKTENELNAKSKTNA